MEMNFVDFVLFADEAIHNLLDNDPREIFANIKNINIDDANKTEYLFIENLYTDTKTRLEKARTDQKCYRKSSIQFWGKCLDLYDMLSVFVSDIAENITKKDMCRKRPSEDNYKYTDIMFILGRALQQYAEIGCLLRGAYPEGALARARSLVELFYVAEFIRINDELVAKSYYDSTENNFEWAKKSPYIQQILEQRKGRRVNISDIRRAIKASGRTADELYDTLCRPIHPSPASTFFRTTFRMDPSRSIVDVGQSIYGIELPARFAMAYLILITISLIDICECLNGKWIANMLNLWYGSAKEAFDKKSDQLKRLQQADEQALLMQDT